MLEKQARNKRSSLFGLFISNKEKVLKHSIQDEGQVRSYKTFQGYNFILLVISSCVFVHQRVNYNPEKFYKMGDRSHARLPTGLAGTRNTSPCPSKVRKDRKNTLAYWAHS
jgi:hypothetical protein